MCACNIQAINQTAQNKRCHADLDVGIGASVEQHGGDLCVGELGGKDQRRVSLRVLVVDLGARLQQLLNAARAAAADREVQRRLLLVVGATDARAGVDERGHGVWLAVTTGHHQRAAGGGDEERQCSRYRGAKCPALGRRSPVTSGVFRILQRGGQMGGGRGQA